ncbi:InlB B-repeat-containing protein [Alicyclobacillus sp. SO9]|uniref:InlB B-repeat-containing protein n=1 Tax=Alicyclobacillus sp. SO9 TaxID=2665646 RepID=UPI0018E730BA|nr:InlB B-repeat-containing protein [Alicyclobacillus sp. SO9]QQE78224.1 InlB B-repeat-containing protein [Alicyclobacillus sp. SO9]
MGKKHGSRKKKMPLEARGERNRLRKSLIAFIVMTPLSWLTLVPMQNTRALAATTGTWVNVTNGGAFSSPEGIAMDSAGDLFVANSGSGTISERASGSTTWMNISNGGAFSSPDGIAVDSAGDLFVTNAGNNIILERASGSTTWTDILGEAGFSWPDGIAVDSAGDLFITNAQSNTILERTSGSTTWTNITNGGSFSSPTGIAVDSAGDLFVTNMANKTILERANGSTTWTDITNGVSSSQPAGIAVDSAGDLFVTNVNTNTLEERAHGSTTWTDITNGGSLSSPTGIVVDSAGDLFVTNSGSNTVSEYVVPPSAPTGLSHSSVTATGWTESWSAVVGATSYNVYVGGTKVNTSPVTTTSYTVTGEQPSTVYQMTVTAVNAAGESAQSAVNSVHTLPPTGTLPPGRWVNITDGGSFTHPYAIAVDSAGDVFVTNSIPGTNSTIQELKSGSTSWNDITYGGSFNGPMGIAVDSAGDLFVTNHNSNTIEELKSGSTTWKLMLDLTSYIAPEGSALDGSGNFYTWASYNGVVIENHIGSATITPLSSSFGQNVNGRVAVDSKGDVFLTRPADSAVYELPSGSTTWVNITNGAGFSDPVGIRVDGAGNVFVVNHSNNTLYERPNGSTTWVNVTNGAGLSNPVGIAIDSAGDLFVTNLSSSTSSPSGSIEEYVLAKNTVTFDSNGGSSVSSESVAYDSYATQPTNPTKTGYVFAGWYTDASLQNPFSFGTPVTGNITLYAKWTPQEYTVNFNSNGGSQVQYQLVPYGQDATAPTNPTRTGSVFAGWYTDSTLQNAFSFMTQITGSLTLYAKWTPAEYTVTFNSNGGSSVSSESVAYDGTATQPTNPTKTGYVFTGWYTDSTLQNQFSFGTLITGNITLYAKWTPQEHTVNFISNGGSQVQYQLVPYGQDATVPTNPTRTGSVFAGWYTDSTLQNAFSFTTPITSSLTLYAKWTPQQYTVTFDSNGGSSVTSESVAYDGTATNPTNPTKTGSVFAGWYTDSTLQNQFSFGTLITGNITLYAKWTPQEYTVNFNSNGGSQVQYQLVPYGSDATAPTNPTKAESVFAGWYTDSTLQNAFSFTTPITSSVTLYAKWTPQQYTVTFNSNGGSSVTSESVAYDSYATAPKNPTKTGAVFQGWYTDSTLQNPFSFGTPVTGSITLYAKWTPQEYTVNFNSNGGSQVQYQLVPYDGTATAPTNPTKAGSVFGGWYTDSTLQTPFSFTTAITGNETLYAKWTPQHYTVSFNSNGGSSVTSESVAYNGNATAPTNPTKTGWVFGGWYTDSTFQNQFSFSTAITGNVTLYAKWTPQEYTVNFNSNGGSQVSYQLVPYGTDATAPTNPTKTGSVFGGWYTDSTLQTPFSFSTAITGNVTLYAKWTPAEYTVTFNSNGGSSVTSESVAYDGYATDPTAPTKTGAVFQGWYTDSTLQNQFSFGTPITGAVTLYAKWTPQEYTVNFNSNGGTQVSYQLVAYEKTPTQPTNPTKTGFVFAGWYTDSTFKNQFSFSTPITGSVTLYAKWTPQQYTVAFNSNGGSSVTSETVAYDSYAIAPTNPTKAGAVFGGWYTDSTLQTQFSFSTAITGNVTLYAKWAPLVNAATPTFSTEPQATQSVTAGSAATVLKVAASVTDGGNVTYQWYSNTTNSTTGGTAISGATSASYTPATASAGTTYYYAVATNTNNSVNGAKTATAISSVATVIVNALVNAATPTFSTEPQATQSVTAGSPAAGLKVAASVSDGGTVTYQWYSNGSNSTTGGTAITGATSASYTPATTSAGTTYYYAVATNTNSSVNGAKTATATSSVAAVTVNALVNAATPTFTTEPQAAQSVTAGSPAAALKVAASVSDGGTVTYQWYKNTTNSTTGGTAITGATSASYTPATASVGTTYYYAVAKNTNNSVDGAKTAVATSTVATVTVNALVNAVKPSFTTEPQATQSVTAGSPAAALKVAASVSDGGAVTYQWYKNTTNSTTGGTAITGATNASYTPATASAGTMYYYAVATNTNNGVNGAKTATATSSVAKVTVNALVNAATPTFTTEPQATESVTAGSTATPLKVAASVSDGGTVTYQWYKNTKNSNTGGTAITGATSASYTPPTTSVGTTYYYAVATNTNNGVNGAKTATATSSVAKVTVNALVNAVTPTFTTEPQATQTVPAGSASTALTVAASVTDGGAVTYQWYKNTVNSNTGGTAITGATSASYTPPTTSVGTTYYYAVATNTNNGVNGAKTATATSSVAKVTVNALVNAATPTFTTEPQATQSVTAGSPATALKVAASVTDGGTVTYQWYKNTKNSNTGGTAITGATSASYTPPTTSVGTTYYYAVATNTNNGVNGAKTATATSSVAKVTVNALVNAVTPTFTTEPQAAQSVTAGSPATALKVAASVTDGGTVTYQWYKNTVNSNTGGTAITGATSASYTPATASPGTMYYYAVATNTNNSVNGTKMATATSSVAKVIVNALVNAVTPTFTTEPQAIQSVTAGSSATALKVAASVTDGGTVTDQWYKNTKNSNTGGTAIIGATSASYTPPTASAGTTYYYAVATNTNTGVTGVKTAVATSSVAQVTVNALVNAVTPTFTTEPQATQSVTVGTPATALTVAATVTDSGTVTYQWYSNTTNSTTGGAVITGATSASYTPATASAGTTYYYAVATNTNVSVNGVKTATATSSVAKVTVNALVNAATPTFTTEPQATQSVTAGTPATALTVAASVTDGGTVTYQWYKNTTNSTSDGTAISGATSATYTPPTTGAGTMYYYAVATNTNSSVNGAKTATATSSVAKVTVNALVNAATPTFTTQPQATQSVTVGPMATPLKVAANVSDGGTVTYQWYSNTTDTNSGGTAITGATGGSYTPSTKSVGTTYYYAVATNTNSSVDGDKTATATSSVAKVTVNAALAPTGLSHSSVAQSGWTESWNAVSGATGYNVYVNGTKVNNSPVTGTSYAVTGETAGASYKVTVTTVSAGAESAASAADTVQTLSVLSLTTGSSLPSVLQGTDYEQSIQAAGGESPYTFSVTKGSLPTGLILQSNGNLVGTPSSNGSYSFTVQVTDKSGDTVAENMSLYVIPAAPAGFLPTVDTKQVVGGSGVTLSAGTSNTHVTLVVATGTFAKPLQMDVTSGTVPSALVPKGQKVITAYGVNFDAKDAPSKPLTFTLLNAEITPQSKVYKIANGKLVPMSAVVTQGKAVITFTTDPDFVVLQAQPQTQSQSQPQTKTVPGATKPVTGFAARPWGAGGLLSILTGGLLLWWQRRRKHHED